MVESPQPFLIVSPSGHEFGSFGDRGRALEYATAIQERRGLACEVVEVEVVPVALSSRAVDVDAAGPPTVAPA